MLPQHKGVGKKGDAFGLPPLVAQSRARRWDLCARCRELVSPPGSFSSHGQQGHARGRAWVAHAVPSPWELVSVGRSVRQPAAGQCRAAAALPCLVRRGVQAVIRRGKDEVDVAGGIPGCEERSLLC